MQLVRLVLFILLGFVVAHITGLGHLQDTSWYLPAVAVLLAIGLYASTYGIVLQEARQHLRIILSAVTIGVVLKAGLIGGSLALIFQDPFFLVLGITVAQIDPLSVASLMKGKRLSAKAKTILASWASFDDPITVILSLYTPLLLAQIFDVSLEAAGSPETSIGIAVYLQGLGFNLLFASIVFALWILIRHYRRQAGTRTAIGSTGAVYTLLATALTVAVTYFMMLGIALIGLFLRPSRIDAFIDQAITWALRAAAIMLGVLLVHGINLWAGVALGIAAYSAQIAVGWLLTGGLARKDRWHISFAQQNGITAIILALLFEPVHPGTVAIVAPAIIVINGLHTVANTLIDKYVLHEKQPAALNPVH